tara:strand:+ start:81 stop:431 length:351 start_codon:yes stop_codon:yes gene_type:complete
MSYNPQGFLNGYLSSLRNGIITITLGVVIYGFSKTFNKKSKEIMKKLSSLIYVFSFFMVLNSNLLFRNHLKILNKKEEEMPELHFFKNFEYLGWFLLTIVFIVFLLSINRYFHFVF